MEYFCLMIVMLPYPKFSLTVLAKNLLGNQKSSHWRCSIKRDDLKNFAKSTGKKERTSARVSF